MFTFEYTNSIISSKAFSLLIYVSLSWYVFSILYKRLGCVRISLFITIFIWWGKFIQWHIQLIYYVHFWNDAPGSPPIYPILCSILQIIRKSWYANICIKQCWSISVPKYGIRIVWILSNLWCQNVFDS